VLQESACTHATCWSPNWLKEPGECAARDSRYPLVLTPHNSRDRYLVVLYWIQTLLDKALNEDLLDNRNSEAHAYMQADLISIRDSVSGVFAHLYCKIPYIYMQLLTFMVKIYLIVVAVIAGSSMRAAHTWLERVLPILLVLVANFAYEGILQVWLCGLLWASYMYRECAYASE
jgi:hypothetical protein